MQASPDRRGRNRRRRPQQGYMVHSCESNGPDIKIRGTPQTIADKYTQLARDSLGGGDLVLAENYFQHAEHYIRLLILDQPIGSSRPPVPVVYDESQSLGDDSELNVAPLEHLQGETQSSASLQQEGRSYERQSRNRDHGNRDHGNGEGYHGQQDRVIRPSAQRYRSSPLSRDDSSRGEHQKRLDRPHRRDPRRDHENAHHQRRSWSHPSGGESEEGNGEHARSQSSTFNQNGLPAFLSAPVVPRAPVGLVSQSPRLDLTSEEGVPSEKKTRKVVSNSEVPESLPVETSESQ